MAERLRTYFDHHVCHLRKPARYPGLHGGDAGESADCGVGGVGVIMLNTPEPQSNAFGLRQLFHVAAGVSPWPLEESTPSRARLPELKFLCNELTAGHAAQAGPTARVGPYPSTARMRRTP